MNGQGEEAATTSAAFPACLPKCHVRGGRSDTRSAYGHSHPPSLDLPLRILQKPTPFGPSSAGPDTQSYHNPPPLPGPSHLRVG